jgi:hypothetical protein
MARLQMARLRLAIAVMTTGSGSHTHAKTTLRGVFRRLLRGFGSVQTR